MDDAWRKVQSREWAITQALATNHATLKKAAFALSEGGFFYFL